MKNFSNRDMFRIICGFDLKSNGYTNTYNKLVNRFQKVIETDLDLISRNNDLEDTLNKIQTLESILPICASYKKIYSEEDQWIQADIPKIYSWFRAIRYGLQILDHRDTLK